MRNVVLALIVLNLSYCAWAHWVDVPRPAAPNPAATSLPRLKLVEETPPAQPPQASAERTALHATPRCLSVGPFADATKSAAAASLLKDQGMESHQRSQSAQTLQSYWVFIDGLTRAQTDHALALLARNGVRDVLAMPASADRGPRISLGLYSDRARAERQVQSVEKMGLNAQVGERKIPGTVYWIDLVPAPGMNGVAVQDLVAEDGSSRIAVQPCPATEQAALDAAGSTTVAGALKSHATKLAEAPRPTGR